MRQQPKVLSDLTSSRDERYMLKKLFDIWVIASRDWLEAASGKLYWVGMLLGPLLLIPFPALLVGGISTGALVTLDPNFSWHPRYYVIDHTDSVGEEIAEVILRERVKGTIDFVHKHEWITSQPKMLQELAKVIANENISDLVDEIVNAIQIQGTITTGSANSFLARLRAWWHRNQEYLEDNIPNYSRYRELKGDYTQRELFEKIYLESLDGYFVIPPDFSSSNRKVRFVSNKFYRDGVQDWYEEKASVVFGDITIVETTIHEEATREKPHQSSFNISNPVDEPSVSESRRKEVSDLIAKIAAGVYLYVLFFAVFVGISLLLNATVEEKSSHIVEVILSNISATQLMDGKLVGAALIFFTMAAVWILAFSAIGGLTSGLIVQLMVSGFSDIMFSFFKPTYVINFLIYLVLGFAFYGYILSAFGSLCSNIREAQPITFVIVILFMVAFGLSFWIVGNPELPFIKVLSFFPPFTPFIMTALMGSLPDWPIYLLNLLVMVAATLGVRLLAGRIYYRGIIAESKPKS